MKGADPNGTCRKTPDCRAFVAPVCIRAHLLFLVEEGNEPAAQSSSDLFIIGQDRTDFDAGHSLALEHLHKSCPIRAVGEG